MRQNTFEKKNKLGEMLIEQFIQFDLAPSNSSSINTFTRTCTPTTGYFYEKTKISKENRVDNYLLLKYFKMQCTSITPT